jgi:hypothetical protein
VDLVEDKRLRPLGARVDNVARRAERQRLSASGGLGGFRR